MLPEIMNTPSYFEESLPWYFDAPVQLGAPNFESRKCAFGAVARALIGGGNHAAIVENIARPRYLSPMDDLFSDRSVREVALTRTDIERLCASKSPSHLIDCDLEEADLAGLDLPGWTFERCNLRRADFTGSKLEGTVWRSCRAAFAQFIGADLSDATVIASDFNNCVLRRSTLTAATFERCKLTGADLSDAKALDVRFEEVLLIHAKLPGYSFRKQSLKKIDFGQADLRKCDFRDTTFEACSLRDAVMTGSRFDGADLRSADLGGLRLIDASLFRGATISREQAGQLLSELGLNVR